MRPTEVSPEQLRILRAAGEYRIRMNDAGRYVIAGEPRPERRERERLLRRGLLAWNYSAHDWGPVLTSEGRKVLEEADRGE